MSSGDTLPAASPTSVAYRYRPPYVSLWAEMAAPGHSVTDGPEIRLAVYGTLAPGRQNHGQLSDLPGRWLVGHVRGSLVEAGWGATLGYPGMHLEPDGAPIEVFVFESQALIDHWQRLDAFEGPGYRRTSVDVSTDEGVLTASIYVLSDSTTHRNPG
jgi:gamma-glutamylcyclotransferase (GGCT)/AIG2-like uncharacterized protein YtfP